MLDIIIGAFIAMLLAYVFVSHIVDTTLFEYRFICTVNRVYNWFKNLFNNGK